MGVPHDFTQESPWYEAYECKHCTGLMTRYEFYNSGGVCPRCGHVKIDWARICDGEKISARRIAFYKRFLWFWARLVKVEFERKRPERLHLPPFEEMYFWTIAARKREIEKAKQAEQAEAN